MIRHAARRLLRVPAFTLAATSTLALGIAGTAAVFTMVNGVLLRPLPYDRADQLVDLSHTLVVSGPLNVDQSDATFLLYARDNHVFAAAAAYRSGAVNLAIPSERRSGTAERAFATFASAGLFRVLRSSPLMGRGFSDDDDRPGAPPTVVIGQRLWESSFNADPAILRRTVTIDGVTRSIIGVMPRRFQFPDAEPALWLPLQLDPAKTKSAAFDYRGVARLRDGVSLDAATADLQRLLPRVPEVFPGRLTAGGMEKTHMRAVVRPLRDVVVGNIGRVLWIVLGAVALLLVVACANVANLFLARTEGRHRELAVRSALGAGRGALLAELLSEAILVSAAGGLLGLAGAWAGVVMLQSLAMGATIPRLYEVRVDGTVVLITLGVTALAALVVSTLPLLRLRSVSIASVLVSGNRSATSGRSRHRARRVLVMAQVALALILVSSAGLLARSFARLHAVDPGFTADHALALRLALPAAGFPTTHDAADVTTRMLGAIAAVPGVRATGAVSKLPLDAETRQDSAVYVEDHPLQPGVFPNLHEIDFATPDYFGAMNIPLVAGRLFDAPDPSGNPAAGPPEVMVSAAFAARYWKGTQAIGKRIRMNPIDPWHTIVGIVGDVRGAGLDQPPSDQVYCPLITLNVAGKPWIPRNLAYVVRTSGDAASIATSVRRAMARVDPTLPPYRVMPVARLVTAAAARTTFTLLLLAIAALVATAIGALGIYGVISYLVSLRTREIGVRLALGAEARDVRLLVARQAVTDALIGVVVGIVGALALGRVLGMITFDVSPTDPVSLGGAAALLVVAAVAASWLPARRAAALDPVTALRSD